MHRMRRVLLGVIITLALMVTPALLEGVQSVAVAASGSELATPGHPLTHTQVMDHNKCVALYTRVKKTPTDADCTMTLRLTVEPMAVPAEVHPPAKAGTLSIPVLSSDADASGTWCNVYSAYQGVGLAGGGSLRVGMCGNWSTVWAVWGPDCSAWTAPIYGWTYTWCGVWNNGGTYADPGGNWYMDPYFAPWIHWSYWYRIQVYSNGSATGTWGG